LPKTFTSSKLGYIHTLLPSYTPFGFGKKDESPVHFNTDITDREELEEIRKIANRLDQDEKSCLLQNSLE
jgi:hypothetical protein